MHRAETSIPGTGSQVPASDLVKSFFQPPAQHSSEWSRIAACWMEQNSLCFCLTFLILGIRRNVANHIKTQITVTEVVMLSREDICTLNNLLTTIKLTILKEES
jgi:hypothetical protein